MELVCIVVAVWDADRRGKNADGRAAMLVLPSTPLLNCRESGFGNT